MDNQNETFTIVTCVEGNKENGRKCVCKGSVRAVQNQGYLNGSIQIGGGSTLLTISVICGRVPTWVGDNKAEKSSSLLIPSSFS